MHNREYEYSTINTVHSHLMSSFINNLLVSKYVKGLFNIKPTEPKTRYIWDVSIMSEYFEKGPDNSELAEKVLP